MIFKIMDKSGDTVEVIEDVDLAKDFFNRLIKDGKMLVGVDPSGKKHALYELDATMVEIQVGPRMVGG